MAAVCSSLDSAENGVQISAMLESVTLLTEEFDAAREELREKFGNG